MKNVRKLVVALFAIAGLVMPGSALAQEETTEEFVAVLSGAEEVPQVLTAATGEATFEVGPGRVVKYELSFENITGVFAAHIHAPALRGQNAGVKQFLCGTAAVGAPPGTPPCNDHEVSGTFVATTALLDQIRNGLAYVNAHTPPHPGGEIRGQIQSEDD